jgi:hypothetical protein
MGDIDTGVTAHLVGDCGRVLVAIVLPWVGPAPGVFAGWPKNGGAERDGQVGQCGGGGGSWGWLAVCRHGHCHPSCWRLWGFPDVHQPRTCS